MADQKTWYMHTIDGRPAYFDGEQIVFAEQLSRWHGDYQGCRLRKTLAVIIRDQEKSNKWRREKGLDQSYEVGYVELSTSSRLRTRSGGVRPKGART